MSRRAWTILGVAAIVLVLIAGSVAGGAYLFLQYRNQRHLAQAEAAFAAQQWDSARRDYAWYLTKHPDDLSSLSRYADACSHLLEDRAGSLREMNRAYFQMASYQPDNVDALYSMLRFQEQHRFWQELEYSAAHFLRQRPQDITLQYYRALALDRLGRQKEAIDLYTLLAEGGTDQLDVYGNLANLLRQQGFPEQAQAVLDQAEPRFADQPYFHLQRCRYLAASQDFSGAKAEIDKALEKAPEDPAILLAAGQVALGQKRWDAAVPLFEKVLALTPGEAEAYLSLAYAYESKGESGKAVALLQSVDPVVQADTPELYLALAEMQLAANRFDDLNQTVNTYRKAYPEHVVIFDYVAAREMLAKGLAAEAAAKLATVCKAKPDFVRAQFYQAVACLQAGQKDLAQSALEGYLRSRPDDGRARDLWQSAFGGPRSVDEVRATAASLLDDTGAPAVSLARAADGLLRVEPGLGTDKDVQLAKQLLEKAMAREPSSPEAYLVLADFLVRHGSADEARRALGRAEAGGVPKVSLTRARAAVALAEKDWDQAKKCLAEDLGRPDVTRAEIESWAALFAGHEQLDTGLEILRGAAQKADAAERGDLEAAQVTLCLRAGAIERAEALIAALDAQGKDPGRVRRLNEAKLSVAKVLSERSDADRERAERLVSAVMDAEPDNATARLLEAQLCVLRQPPDYVKAETLAQAVLASSPSDANVLLFLAGIAQRKGQFARALEYANHVPLGAGEAAHARLAVAEAEAGMGRYSEARDILEKELAAHPNDTRILALLARTYVESGQGPQAESMLKRLETAGGQDSGIAKTVASLRGSLAVRGEKWAEAEAALRAQHEANPDDLSIVQALARALTGQGRTAEAERLLRGYANGHNASVDAWTALGRFYLAPGQGQANLMEASSAFTRALFLMPDYAPALRCLIEVQARTNSAGSALSLCERYLSAQPNDVDVLYEKATLLAKNPGTLDKALETIQRAVGLAERPELLWVRGTLYLALGKYSEAATDFQRVGNSRAVAPANVDAAMAEAYLGLKEWDLARRYYDSAREKAAKADSSMLQRLEQLGKRLESESGQKS